MYLLVSTGLMFRVGLLIDNFQVVVEISIENVFDFVPCVRTLTAQKSEAP